MIDSIYPYIVGASAPGPRKNENSFRDLTDGRANTAAQSPSAPTAKTASMNPLTSLDGLQVAMSGFVSSSSLITDVPQADLSQGIPRMIRFQRGYEANLKALQTEDEILKQTLDIVV